MESGYLERTSSFSTKWEAVVSSLIREKFHYWDSQSKCDLLTGAFANLQSTLDVTYARYQENRAHGLSHRSSIAKIDFDMQLPNEFLAMTDRFFYGAWSRGKTSDVRSGASNEGFEHANTTSNE